jgi:Uma2 family endonuclease
MERSAAFYIGKNFKKYIFTIITELPFSWHSDNHSGETINKVNKATQALDILRRWFDSSDLYLASPWYLGIWDSLLCLHEWLS